MLNDNESWNVLIKEFMILKEMISKDENIGLPSKLIDRIIDDLIPNSN